jgi:hypothetical protein
MSRREIVRMVFGSHLYGTATAASDRDYRGVFMPAIREVLLGRIPKTENRGKPNNGTKNAPGEVDTELYSLHYFVSLACEGQTVALDMLHAPESAWIGTPRPEWAYLVKNRSEFYTRSLKALIGYARRQASKYGIKGSRLADARRVLAFFEARDQDTVLADLWEQLPSGDHIRCIAASPESNNQRMYEVCGRKFIESSKIGHYLPTLAKFVSDYGERARMAERSEGVDWKAVSHAFRAAYQVRAVLVDGGFTYPLRETPRLVQIKAGALPYAEVAAELEDLIDGVEALSEGSSLPDAVNRAFWDEWLAEVVRAHVEGRS